MAPPQPLPDLDLQLQQVNQRCNESPDVHMQTLQMNQSELVGLANNYRDHLSQTQEYLNTLRGQLQQLQLEKDELQRIERTRNPESLLTSASQNATNTPRRPNIPFKKFTNEKGDNFLTFRQLFEDNVQIYQWTDEEAKRIVRQYLDGKALESVIDLNMDHYSTIKDVLDEFQTRFLPKCKSKLLRTQFEYTLQKPSESVSDLHSRLRTLFTLSFPGINPQTDERLIERFIDALEDRTVQNYVRRRSPDTYSEALNVAHQETAFVLADRARHGGTTSFNSKDELYVGSVDPPRDSFRQGPSYRPPPARRPMGPSSRAPEPPTCYQCGRRGHIRAECRSGPRPRSDYPHNSTPRNGYRSSNQDFQSRPSRSSSLPSFGRNTRPTGTSRPPSYNDPSRERFGRSPRENSRNFSRNTREATISTVEGLTEDHRPQRSQAPIFSRDHYNRHERQHIATLLETPITEWSEEDLEYDYEDQDFLNGQ